MNYKTNYATLEAFPEYIQADEDTKLKGYRCELFGQTFWIPKRAFEFLFSLKKEDTFCRIEAEVCALQYTEHTSTSQLQDFISPSKFTISSEPDSEGDLFIYGEGSSTRVQLYDYIVKDYLGNFRAIAPIVFQQVYKRI